MNKAEEILKKLMSSKESLYFDAPLFKIEEHSDTELADWNHNSKYVLIEQTDGMIKYKLTKEEHNYLKEL